VQAVRDEADGVHRDGGLRLEQLPHGRGHPRQGHGRPQR
jgi:hypothetical protein